MFCQCMVQISQLKREAIKLMPSVDSKHSLDSSEEVKDKANSQETMAKKDLEISTTTEEGTNTSSNSNKITISNNLSNNQIYSARW